VAALAQVRPVLRSATPREPRAYRRISRGVLLGTTAAGAVLLGRASGFLEGGPGLLVAALLVLLVPTSREISRRILLAGCLVLGWSPLLWWWDLPVGGLGRATLGLAAVAGALGGWVGSGAHPGQRARRLLPRVRAVDVLVPMSVALGAVVLRPWLEAKSAAQTLGLLMAGWDNSAHFSMVHMIRRFGVSVDSLAPPLSGETWQFASYPQGFHAVVATVIELMVGPSQADLGTELLAYARAVALLLIVATAMLVAGFCALPVLRRRPGIAAPVAAFVTAVFVFGPGANAIDGGFGNFAVACVLVVAIALVGVPMARVLSPLHLAAMGGAVVGIAAGWALLLALAAPALLIIVLPLRRHRWSASPARLIASVAVGLAVLGCLVRTVIVIARVQVDNPLVLTGGIVPPDLGLVVASILATSGACLMMGRGSTGLAGRGPGPRAAALGAVPLVGAVVATALIVMQIRSSGSVTYYGLKFMTGLEIVLLAILMIPSVYILARRKQRRPTEARLLDRGRGFVASTALALAATQAFGLAAPDREGLGLSPEAPGAANRAQQIRLLLDPPSTADLADRVELLGRRTDPGTVFYLDVPSDRRVDPILAAQWFFALTDSWTIEGNAVASGIRLVEYSGSDVAAAARRILRTHPDSVVAVRSEYAEILVRALDRPDLADRIVGV
jgi:hypothetical protein